MDYNQLQITYAQSEQNIVQAINKALEVMPATFIYPILEKSLNEVAQIKNDQLINARKQLQEAENLYKGEQLPLPIDEDE